MMLFKGLIWLALATIAEVPTVVFLWLNLNRERCVYLIPSMLTCDRSSEVMNLVSSMIAFLRSIGSHHVQMFFTPEMVILVIGATRMYRALSTHFTTAYEYAPPSHPHFLFMLTLPYVAQASATQHAANNPTAPPCTVCVQQSPSAKSSLSTGVSSRNGQTKTSVPPSLIAPRLIVILHHLGLIQS